MHTLLDKYDYNDQIKEGEMDRACSIYGPEEKCTQSFGSLKKKIAWKKNKYMEMQTILKLMFSRCCVLKLLSSGT
jgi:hypothetical protein